MEPSSHGVSEPAGGDAADAGLSGVGVGADLDVGGGHSEAVVVVDGGGHSTRVVEATPGVVEERLLLEAGNRPARRSRLWRRS